MDKMSLQDYAEINIAMESILQIAMETTNNKHVIDPKVRDSLPDKAFGIIYTDADGKKQRKYPLVVKNNPEATKELVAKAIQFFHYCKPEWKPQLAKKIIQVIRQEELKVTINKKSQILKYIKESQLPPNVILIDSAK